MKIRFLPIVLLLGACSDARINQFEQRLDSELRQMREEIATQNNQLEELRSEIGRVTGKVEEVQHVATGRTQELEQTLKRVSSRVPPPPPVPEQLLIEDEQQIARFPGTATELFLTGLSQLREGEFANARDTFSRFVDENEKTTFTDNALFWQGISYEGLGQFDRSVSSYSVCFQKFPAEDRVDACIFKLAENFEKMGQKKDAQLTFEKLLDEFPKSRFAPEARERLALLKPAAAKGKPAPKKR